MNELAKQCYETEVSKRDLTILNSPTTTYNYTTIPCVCTVLAHDITLNMCEPECGVKATSYIGLPTTKVNGCGGAKFLGFRIKSVPTSGTLHIGTTLVIDEQLLTKQEMSALFYMLTTETAVLDTFTYMASYSCGDSPVYTVTLNVLDCSSCTDCGDDDDCGCNGVTTTTSTTTIP
jgi:hypothetical protein